MCRWASRKPASLRSADTIATCWGTKSTLESNLRSMHSQQQSGQKGGYIKASYAATPALEKKRARDIFSTAGSSPLKPATEQHNHLKNFLQTQQDLFKRQEINYRKSH
jgi:hypothetical protein